MKQWMVLGVVGVLTAVAVSQADAKTVRMVSGQAESVQEVGFPVSRVHLEGDRYVAVELNGRQVRLTPLAVGRANLTLYDAAGKAVETWRVVVSDSPPVDPDAVRAMLIDDAGRPLPTLFCDEIPGSQMVRITGRVMQQRDLDSLRRAERAFEGGVVNLTTIDATYFEKMAEEIRKKVNVPGINVSHAGETVFLSGQAFSVMERSHIEALARATYPRVESFITVREGVPPDVSAEKPLIQLECQILEVANDAAREMGVDWGGLLPITVSAEWSSERGGGGPSGFVSMNTEYLLKALIPQIQKGSAKVLYTQNLVCENGENARFFAGGSFWIVASIQGTGDITTEEVEYGMSMELKPFADKFNNIGTKVNIEFSTLGPTVNGYPSLLKRYVRTSVNVKKGQTLSLGSLLGSETRESIKKIPILGDIPVLGELFKSKTYQDGKSEMVILITPRVVVPGDEANEALRKSIEEKAKAPHAR